MRWRFPMRSPLLAALVLLCSCAHRSGSPPSTAAVAPPVAPAATPAHDHAAVPSLSLEALARGALLLPGLGEYHRAVATRSPEAQRYFDQGLRLTYGFNHDEAARSYARAAELDPSCALCFWGA